MKRAAKVIGLLAVLVAGFMAATPGTVSALVETVVQQNDQVCEGLTSGKIDVSGDHKTITITAPAGYLIDRYCVKAGSANQGDGPVYVDVIPPTKSVTFSHPSGKDISHYSYRLIPETPETTTTTTTTEPPPTTTTETTTQPPPTTTEPPETTETTTTTTTTPPETTQTTTTAPPAAPPTSAPPASTPPKAKPVKKPKPDPAPGAVKASKPKPPKHVCPPGKPFQGRCGVQGSG